MTRLQARLYMRTADTASPTTQGVVPVIFMDLFRKATLALAMGLVLLMAAACDGAAADSPSPTAKSQAPALVSPAPGTTTGQDPVVVTKESPDDAVASAASEVGESQGKGQPASETGTPEPAETRQLVALGPAPGIEPDPDYKEALADSRLPVGEWTTDFSLRSVPFDEIVSGGPPRDGIPPLDSPSFVNPDAADQWLGDKEPVISFELNGEARAYPLQILTWHEIVNDEVGGVPVTVTFCPLCNSAIVFDRRLEGVTLDFGTSGRLRNSDLIMWDRQTESWWQQFTGEAIIGRLTGHTLDFLPAQIVSWADFKTAHPAGQVLSKETGYNRSYGRNPYGGYDEVGKPPFLFFGDLDGRLLPKERVVALTIDGVDVAFPFSLLEEEGVVNYSLGDANVAVFFKKGTTSALDGSSIRDSRDIGAAAAFDANLDGRTLTFAATEDGFTDSETGSSWNILGQSTGGELAGASLTPMVHANHFWFAWAAFKPDTRIYQGDR